MAEDGLRSLRDIFQIELLLRHEADTISWYYEPKEIRAVFEVWHKNGDIV